MTIDSSSDSTTTSAFTISQVAELTGLSTHTLRYYERAGLMLAPIDRAPSQQRRYTDADVRFVRFLTQLRATSMPIAQVREYVSLVRAGDDATPQRLEMLLRHRIAVQAQLDEITTSLAAIDYKIATYQGKAPRL